MDQQSRVSSSNSQTLVIPPSDQETLVRSSSSKSRSSGYHSNDDVSPVPKDNPAIPSQPLPPQKNSPKEQNVGRKEIFRVSEKAEVLTKKLPVKHSKSDGHEKHSSPVSELTRSSLCMICTYIIIHSMYVHTNTLYCMYVCTY